MSTTDPNELQRRALSLLHDAAQYDKANMPEHAAASRRAAAKLEQMSGAELPPVGARTVPYDTGVMSTTRTTTRPRGIERLASIVGRVEREGFGRNERASFAAVESAYMDAVADVVRLDDARQAARLTDVQDPAAARAQTRLNRWRDRAIAAGLLSARSCVELEAAAIMAVDAS